MKKNIRVNIRGILFNIDEDAYAALDDYLKRIEAHFGESEGGKEIIEDIESGIAEMMSSKLSDSKEIINIDDVNEIIRAMGEPGEIDGEADSGSGDKKQKRYYEQTKRRLYRDSDDKVVAGVCSGISRYLNLDVAIVRIIFVLLTIFWGGGLLAYLVLWIAVPEAVTTAQKLEMEGENVTIDNIEKKIREELDKLGDQLNELKNKHFPKKKAARRKAEKSKSLLTNMLSAFAKIFFTLLMIIIAVSFIVSFISFIPALFVQSGMFINISDHFIVFSIPEIVRALVYDSANEHLVEYALSSLVLIPLIAVIIFAGGVIFNIRSEAKGINKALGVIWIVSLLIIVYTAVRTAASMDHSAKTIDEQTFDFSKYDTLFVEFEPDRGACPELDEDLAEALNVLDNRYFIFRDSGHYFSIPVVESHTSKDSLVRVKITKYSRGDKSSAAKRKTLAVKYEYLMNDSLLELSPLFSFPESERWRQQRVKVDIYVPVGKEVKFVNNPDIRNKFYKEVETELLW